MSAIFEQLGLDETFFTQLILIAALFVALKPLYFGPFLKLFEARYKSTIADQESAEKLMADAQAKLEEYKRRILEGRMAARKDYEALLDLAKKEEATFLQHAREEAKRITQQAVESVALQHAELKKKLDLDVESLAHNISETLLLRKG